MDITDKIDSKKFEQKVKEISETQETSEVDVEEFLLNLGPKKLYKMGLLEGEGWKEGYTKKSLKKKKAERKRKKKKK